VSIFGFESTKLAAFCRSEEQLFLTTLLGQKTLNEAWAFLNAQSCALKRRNAHGLPLQFVPQNCLPEGQAYESFIAQTGQVPTRPNAHDALNAMMWFAWPQSKAALNCRQAAEIVRLGSTQTRGAWRDKMTLMDENGAIVVLPKTAEAQAWYELWQAHDWVAALWVHRAYCQNQLQLHFFGHALLEKLLAPYKGITAHCWVVFAPDSYFCASPCTQKQWLDAHLAEQFFDAAALPVYLPLPVLGWPRVGAPVNLAYYQDPLVFRPRR
jgi:hypothetical protein